MVVAAALRSLNAAGCRWCVAVLMVVTVQVFLHHHSSLERSQAQIIPRGEHGMTASLRATLARRAQAMDSESSSETTSTGAATSATDSTTTTTTTAPASTTSAPVSTTLQPNPNASTSESPATSTEAAATSVTTTLTTPQPERRPGGGQCRGDMPDLSNPVEVLQNLAVVGENVICPFLGTLLKAGVLPPVCVLHRSQLLQITVDAGLPIDRAMPHIESNFRNIPGGFIDICCMEGSTAEHLFSTGIHDCETMYLNCARDERGVLSCADVQTEQCSLPNRNRFESFFTMLDTDLDDNITRSELGALVETDFFNDANPGGEGTIRGSFGLLMDVFGHVNATGQPDHFTKAALEQVLLRREFPPHYNPVALMRAA